MGPSTSTICGLTASTITLENRVPGPRADGRMVYDPRTKAFFLFSGNDYSGSGFAFHHVDDMWRYAWNTGWVLLVPGTSPSPRDYPVFATDTASGELILTGGFGEREILGDTWAFNTTRSSWANVTTSEGPEPRMAAVGGYDPWNDVLVLFSGGDNAGAKGDTWLFRYPPPIELEISFATSSAMTGTRLTFEASLHGGSGRFTRIRWQFGDGGIASGPQTSHSYSWPGVYRVMFEAVDDRGQTSVWDHPLAIGWAAPNLRELFLVSVAAIGLLGAGLFLPPYRRSSHRPGTRGRSTSDNARLPTSVKQEDRKGAPGK